MLTATTVGSESIAVGQCILVKHDDFASIFLLLIEAFTTLPIADANFALSTHVLHKYPDDQIRSRHHRLLQLAEVES